MSDKKRTKISKSVKTKLRQSTLFEPEIKVTKCAQCGYEWIKTIKKSVTLHNMHHDDFLNGLTLPKPNYNTLINHGNCVDTFKVGGSRLALYMCKSNNPVITKIVDSMMKTLNKVWLNSMGASTSWRNRPDESPAFLLVEKSPTDKLSRVIGITTTDPPPKQQAYIKGYCMELETANISSKEELKLSIGISRIYVCPKYRRHHLAMAMLDAVLCHSLYGVKLNQWQIGFSQPSGAGTLLLKKWYNNSKHIPVYHEVDN